MLAVTTRRTPDASGDPDEKVAEAVELMGQVVSESRTAAWLPRGLCVVRWLSTNEQQFYPLLAHCIGRLSSHACLSAYQEMKQSRPGGLRVIVEDELCRVSGQIHAEARDCEEKPAHEYLTKLVNLVALSCSVFSDSWKIALDEIRNKLATCEVSADQRFVDTNPFSVLSPYRRGVDVAQLIGLHMAAQEDFHFALFARRWEFLDESLSKHADKMMQEYRWSNEHVEQILELARSKGQQRRRDCIQGSTGDCMTGSVGVNPATGVSASLSVPANIVERVVTAPLIAKSLEDQIRQVNLLEADVAVATAWNKDVTESRLATGHGAWVYAREHKRMEEYGVRQEGPHTYIVLTKVYQGISKKRLPIPAGCKCRIYSGQSGSLILEDEAEGEAAIKRLLDEQNTKWKISKRKKRSTGGAGGSSPNDVREHDQSSVSQIRNLSARLHANGVKGGRWMEAVIGERSKAVESELRFQQCCGSTILAGMAMWYHVPRYKAAGIHHIGQIPKIPELVDLTMGSCRVKLDSTAGEDFVKKDSGGKQESVVYVFVPLDSILLNELVVWA